MSPLEQYITSKLEEARASNFEAIIIAFESHCMGAVEICTKLFPDQEKEIIGKWNMEWHPKFVQEIYRVRGA